MRDIAQVVQRFETVQWSAQEATTLKSAERESKKRLHQPQGAERMRRAKARREREFDERLQQADARIGAECSARPSTEILPAPALGTPRSRATSDVVEDGQPDDQLSQQQTPGAAKPHGTRHRAMTSGARTQSGTVACHEGRRRQTTRPGCEQAEA